MEAGSGSGGRASFIGEDGLIAGAVFLRVGFGFGAVDVGREWEMADAVECGVEVGDRGEAEGAFAEVGGGEDGGCEGRQLCRPTHRAKGMPDEWGTRFCWRFDVVEVEGFAGLDLFCWFYEGGPVVVVGGEALG